MFLPYLLMLAGGNAIVGPAARTQGEPLDFGYGAESNWPAAGHWDPRGCGQAPRRDRRSDCGRRTRKSGARGRGANGRRTRGREARGGSGRRIWIHTTGGGSRCEWACGGGGTPATGPRSGTVWRVRLEAICPRDGGPRAPDYGPVVRFFCIGLRGKIVAALSRRRVERSPFAVVRGLRRPLSVVRGELVLEGVAKELRRPPPKTTGLRTAQSHPVAKSRSTAAQTEMTNR
jgi:hypothetical protein